MARLVSSPKPAAAPAATSVVTPLSAGAAAPSTVSPAFSTTPDAATPAEQNLLRRATGRAGTVLTGWRGILGPGSLAPARKKLLGE